MTNCHIVLDSNLYFQTPPASVTEIRQPAYRLKFDFSDYTDVRVCAYVSSSVTSSYTGSLSYQWSVDQSTWSWFGATTGQPAVMCGVNGAQTSVWVGITGSLTGSVSGSDVWIRPVTYNGDSTTTLWFNTLTLQAK